ncbi:ATP-binding protein [Candidatus Pacearchaeota archaeon]|nr:ATP-binding protein [Candidatus Pacearchaeota archaeon]
MLQKDKFNKISDKFFPRLSYKDIPNKPFLILFSGVPCSGKTTIAKLIEERYKGIRLNTDFLREIISDLNLEESIEDIETLVEEYVFYLAKRKPFINQFWIFDASIDRKYKKIISFCREYNLKFFIINLDISKNDVIIRLKKRNKENLDNWLQRIDSWYEDHNNFKKNIKPDINLKSKNIDLENLFGILDKRVNCG